MNFCTLPILDMETTTSGLDHTYILSSSNNVVVVVVVVVVVDGDKQFNTEFVCF